MSSNDVLSCFVKACKILLLSSFFAAFSSVTLHNVHDILRNFLPIVVCRRRRRIYVLGPVKR